MTDFVNETERLIAALPPNGDLREAAGECPLGYDASGTKTDHFVATALNLGVAKALHEGRSRVPVEVEQQLAHEANFRSPTRMGEYARCLLARASGNCLLYDAKAERERTQEEAVEYMKTGAHQNG